MNVSSSVPRRARVAAGLAGLVTASALVLTGCTNPIDQIVQGGIENGVEQLIEENTGADIDVNTGGGASLPEGWPADLPVPNDSPQFSMGAADGYQATFTITDASEGEAIRDELIASGYEMTGESDMGAIKTWILTGPEWQVSLAVIIPEDDVDSASLTYIVSPTTE